VICDGKGGYSSDSSNSTVCAHSDSDSDFEDAPIAPARRFVPGPPLPRRVVSVEVTQAAQVGAAIVAKFCAADAAFAAEKAEAAVTAAQIKLPVRSAGATTNASANQTIASASASVSLPLPDRSVDTPDVIAKRMIRNLDTGELQLMKASQQNVAYGMANWLGLGLGRS
jgi:hypothetical protein